MHTGCIEALMALDHAPAQIPCPAFESEQMLPCPAFESEQTLPCAEDLGARWCPFSSTELLAVDSTASTIERHPMSSGIFARLDSSGKLWLMDDGLSQPGRNTRLLATTKSTALLCALTSSSDFERDSEDELRPCLCWAPGLGQNVVLTCSDGATIEYWHAKRDLNHITRKASFSPYHVNSSMVGNVNSVSCDSGGEYCMVADELCIYIWKLADLNGKQPPQVALDLTPDGEEDVPEVITCARFHPKECGTVVIGFDTGRVAFFDFSTTKRLGGSLRELEVPDHECLLGEFAAAVTDLTFSEDASKLYVRDQVTVRVYAMCTPLPSK